MHKLPIVELEGSAKEMGEVFGEVCRDEIHALYDIRIRAAIRFAKENGNTVSEEYILGVCRNCLPATETYDPEGYKEFTGIAHAAMLSPEQLYALQGLTDVRDVLRLGPLPDGMGCSSFMVAGDRVASGQLLLGQTWDLHTDNMPFVRLVHRKPENAPETWSLTLVGCLTLVGINAEGIAVGNTNLETTDARMGVQYLTVLHRALRSRSLAEAVQVIGQAPRSAAHYYYVAGPDGVATGVECSATQAVCREFKSGTYVHCNHALDAKIASLEVHPPTLSSQHRQMRLADLLRSHKGFISIEDVKRYLSDHEGGPDRCICRHDFDGISTNAAIIMSPGTFEIHACRSQAHLGEWVTNTLVR
jgi:isopenicillin-N N-acyltransferase-like protein